MHETVRQPGLQSPEPPDTVFSFVVGLYVALLVSPALVGVVALTVTGDASVLYLSFLCVLTAVTAAGTWVVGRWRGLPERLGATPLSRLLGVAPAIAAAANFAGLDALGGVAMAGFFLSAAGIPVGVVLSTMAETRYATAVVDDDAVRAAWQAGWPQPLRKRVQIGALVGHLSGTVLFFGGDLMGLGAYEWVGGLAFVTGSAFLAWGQPRRYRLSTAGIERSNHVHRRLYEWDSFESFSVTEDAIVLHRSGLRPAFRCWRAEIDDEDELIAALDDHRPRT